MSTSDERIAILRALAEQKNTPLHGYGLTIKLRASGRIEEAVEVFRRIHALDSEYVPAHFMRAQAHEKLGDLEAARAALKEGVRVAKRTGDEHAASKMRAMRDALPE